MFLYGCGYSGVKVDNQFVSELSEKYNSNSTDLENQNKYIQLFSHWHTSFNSSELQDLILLALSNNLDISKAIYSLQASAQQLGDQRQALFPSLSLQAQNTKQNYSKEAAKNLHIIKRNNTLQTLGLTASYELDIWGKNYSAYNAAKDRLKAKTAEFDGIRISIVANMMNLWVNLMTLRQEMELLENRIIDIESILEIQEANYSSGSISITDLFQQQSQLLEIQNRLKELKNSETETLRSINILLGRDPLEELIILSKKLPQLPKLPSDELNIIVLANRPDIREAFYNLVASERDVKVANLNRLPSFNLQSVLDIGVDGLSIKFDNWLLKTILQASMPLFQAGALYNKEQAFKLLTKANVVNYKQVVFKAINEVKGALDNELKYIESIQNITKQLNLMEETKVQLQNKYLNGDTNYLEFLNANSRVIDLRTSLIERQKDMLLNRILLYRALGITVEDKEKVNDKA